MTTAERFTEVIRDKMVSIPAPVQTVDRFARWPQLVSVPIDSAVDMRCHLDGRVEFAKKFDVRRYSTGLFELAYVLAPNELHRSKLLVSRFAEAGGLACRLWFEQMAGGITKGYETEPWASINRGPTFHRFLENDEPERLLKVMREPADYLGDLKEMSTPNETEEAMLEACREDLKAIDERFRESIKNLEEAERIPFIDPGNLLLG